MIERSKILFKGFAVLVLSVVMLLQPIMSTQLSNIESQELNPFETIQRFVLHVFDLEYAPESLFNSDNAPVSENYPEKQDAESENESIEKDKDDYNLDESSFESMAMLLSTQRHLTHSPYLNLTAYRGKIPTPPPEV